MQEVDGIKRRGEGRSGKKYGRERKMGWEEVDDKATVTMFYGKIIGGEKMQR